MYPCDSYPPLYTALTTGRFDGMSSMRENADYSTTELGLAGSTTSFSSWMLDGFESFANLGHYDRGGLRDVSRRAAHPPKLVSI